jgi:hemerythrin-like domain-containing protein
MNKTRRSVRKGRTSDPIARFLEEHTEALIQLKKLNKAVDAFSQNGYSSRNYGELVAALKFINEEVTVHNLKEEEALFPVIERYVEGPTNILRIDHRLLKKEFTRLARAVARVNKHRDSFSGVKHLRTVAQSVVQILVNHIHKENLILFPFVQRFLTREELREIARRMLQT